MKKIASVVLALSMILALGAAQAQTKTSHKKATTEVTTQKKDHTDTGKTAHHYHKKKAVRKTSRKTGITHHHSMKGAKADSLKK